MLNQVMVSMILWLRSNISGMQYLFLDSLLSVADRLVMIIICSILLWGGVTQDPFRIEWFVWSQTAAYFTVMFVALVIVIRRGGVSGVRPDAGVLKSIITAGLPYAVVVFAMTLYWRIDAVLLERLLPEGAQEAGIYAQAFRLFDAFAMIPVMFGGLLLPIMSKELSAGNNIKPLATMAGRMLLAPLGAGAVTLASFPGEILDLLYVAPSSGATHAFILLMLTLIPVAIIFIYSTVLTAAGSFRLLGLITMGGMVLNVALNLVLIPSHHAPGSAFAALATQSVVAMACVLAAEKTMFRTVAAKSVLLYLLMLALTFVAGRLFRLTGMPWMAAAALQFLAGISFALTFRMIEPLKSLKLIFERSDSI
jgi:O-antigen/teichoic acid export membrane protein